MTTHYDHCKDAAKKIVDRVGKQIVIGVPLGLGKPIGLLNALYRLAEQDTSIQLTIITGLTLSRPLLHHELEKRLVEPIMERLLKDYEDPLYERPREQQQLPSNINVIEFFLSPGRYLHNQYVQQNYISSSYTHVVRDALHHSINVLAQLVSTSPAYPDQYSLSCNTDLFKDVARHLREKSASQPVAIVAEVNPKLPFMLNDALIKENEWTDVIDTKQYHSLFAIPRDELSIQDHLIGFYTSCLVKDDSCLQIGIGKLSNAVANALIMRHENNEAYQNVLKKLSVVDKFGDTLKKWGEQAYFEAGLYASTEMVSDEYMALYKKGILKKRVYDHVGLQLLLNEKKITETVSPAMLDVLLENKFIHPILTKEDVEFLKQFGIFKQDIQYQNNQLTLPSGLCLSTEIALLPVRQQIGENCLGQQLKSGKIIHAGFFFGTDALYETLRSLPLNQLQQIDMTTISKTNTMTWSPELAKLQRKEARFINSAMMATLGGVVISDGIENLQEISGVGGQFDFVSMAHQLPGALSIINCRSTRQTKTGIKSNILWDYSNVTLPRYLRDIVITEYGIADCRSKTDADVIKAMLNITDSAFQETLLAKAKQYGKLPKHYEIPSAYRQNNAAAIQKIISDFKSQGYFLSYPFGSDLTEEEKVLARALLFLKNSTKLKILSLFATAFFLKEAAFAPYLKRMRLDKTKRLKEYGYKKILLSAIQKTQWLNG